MRGGRGAFPLDSEAELSCARSTRIECPTSWFSSNRMGSTSSPTAATLISPFCYCSCTPPEGQEVSPRLCAFATIAAFAISATMPSENEPTFAALAFVFCQISGSRTFSRNS